MITNNCQQNSVCLDQQKYPKHKNFTQISFVRFGTFRMYGCTQYVSYCIAESISERTLDDYDRKASDNTGPIHSLTGLDWRLWFPRLGWGMVGNV